MMNRFSVVIALVASGACQQYRGGFAAGEFALAAGDGGAQAAMILYDIAEYFCPQAQGVQSSTCDEKRKRAVTRLDLVTGSTTEVARLAGGHRLLGIASNAEMVVLHSGETYDPFPGHLDWRADRVDWIDVSGGVVGRATLPVLARYATSLSPDGRSVFLYAEGPATVSGALVDRVAVVAHRDLSKAIDLAVPGRLVGGWWTDSGGALLVAVGDVAGALLKFKGTSDGMAAGVSVGSLPDLERLKVLSAVEEPRGSEIVADTAGATLAYTAAAKLRIAQPADGGVIFTRAGPTRVAFSPGGERVVATTPGLADGGGTVTVVRIADGQETSFGTTLSTPFARVTAGATGPSDALVVVVDADAFREKVLYGTEVGRNSQLFQLSGASVATVSGTTIDRFAIQAAGGGARLAFFAGSTLRAIDMASGAATIALTGQGPGALLPIGLGDLLSFRIERVASERGAFQHYGVFVRLAPDAGAAMGTAWRAELGRTAD